MKTHWIRLLVAFAAVGLVAAGTLSGIAADGEKKGDGPKAEKPKADKPKTEKPKADKPKTEAGKEDAAVARTRKQVKMLDDLYKTAVVLITKHYVNKESDVSAGTAAKALFAEMKKAGWHDVRLLDATGHPYEDKNVAQDDFEKKAIAALKSGKEYYEEVVSTDKGRSLRAATPIPVVMDKCIMCHPHYKDVKKGAAIGALSYTLPIE